MHKIFSVLVAVMALTVPVISFADDLHTKSNRQEADVTRKVAPPFYTGVLQLEPRKDGEEIKLCPVLKVDGKTYRLRTYTEKSCKESIDSCKPGERCVVKGEVSSEGDLFAEEFTSFAKGEKAPVVKEERLTKKTKSGAEFKRVSEEELHALGIKDTKKFGEAWQDPSGRIWSDIAKKEDGSALNMNQKDAETYCKNLGAELPSGYIEDQNGKHGGKDSDFVALRKYMGAKSLAGYGAPEGYAPEILPNLTGWNWSSSVLPDNTNFAYDFDGRDGLVSHYYRSSSFSFYGVRCVVRASSVGR